MTTAAPSMTEALLAAAGLLELLPRARSGEAFGRIELERVASAANPLAAAALADARRAALYGDTVTMPVTLRVRAGWAADDDAELTSVLHVTHELDGIDGIDATEVLLVGACPESVSGDDVCASVAAVKAARPDLALRGLDAAVARRIGDGDLTTGWTRLRAAGLDVLGHGAAISLDEWRATRLHHFPLPYSCDGLADTATGGYVALLGRLAADEEFVDATVAFVPLPDATAESSPLRGTAGTEDVLAFALARLALVSARHHVAVDSDVLGQKLGAMLLSAGASDFIGAQAAREWTIPKDDEPRPLNEARAQLYIREARREPVRRDGLLTRSET